MSHKYKLNQLVRLTRRVFADRALSTTDVFEITRLMPADQTGEFSYHIKSAAIGERVVRESDLVALGNDR
ncbi:hypothetical protein F0L46_16815 [Salinarimonas soli]|uniref:Uncharacterized protein n=2 Tax=Salinarimonas soli TaxID=1638099 RepID=A0A5B2VAM7_9HYPH|nr:hypothetical protein F0L46_16815 [Salinarimonas soli]